MPAGLSLSTGGILNGQPTIAGTYQFTVTATDSSNHNLTGTLKYSLTVNPALAIGPAALSTATVGDLFHTQLTATGGSGKSYTFTASDLPSGLTLSATGLLSGTPTSNTGSPLKFTVTVGDSNGSTTSHNYTLTVDPALAISPATLAVATVGNKVSKQLTATGGSEKGYTFTASGLPSWLTLTSAGLLSGTPTTATTSPLQITVTVTDSIKATGSISYTLTINPALTLSPSTLPVATVSNSFSKQLTAGGGSGTGYTFTATGLPSWLKLSSAGLLSGTPTTATGSPLHFTITLKDSNAVTTSHAYALTIDPALAVGPATLPVATIGNKLSKQLTGTGGSGKGYTFTASGLPSWLRLSTTGMLIGTPPAGTGSSVSLTVTITDSNGAMGSKSYTLTVDPVLGVNPATLAVATVGDKFNTQLTGTGGSGKGYTFTASGLPSWLAVTSAGLLSGTPTTATNSPLQFTVTVTDSLKATGSASETLTIDPALTLSPGTLPVATVSNSFSKQLTPGGGSGAGYTFTATGLPSWLKLSSAGLLSGTPTTATGSPLHFTVTVKDSNAGTASHAYVLTIDPALAVGPATLPVATIGDKLSTQLTGSGGSGTGYTFTASKLPTWLTLSTTGLLSGTPPSSTGLSVSFTVAITDSNSATGSKSYTLTVDPALAISPATLAATLGNKFSTQLTATGGSGKGYTFTASGLPSWLKLTSAGLLSGTPTTATNSPLQFTITVTDSLKATGSASETLTIDPALTLSPGTLPVATVGNLFSKLLAAGGGSGTGYTFTATGLPSWLKLTSAGQLSGTPTTTTGSPLHFTVTVKDSNAGTTSYAYSLTIDPALAVGPKTLPVATIGSNFSKQLTATGGSGTGYTFTASGLPSWLMLSTTGLLSGTPPSGTGTSVSLTVTVTDSNGATGSNSYTLTVDQAQ